MVVNFANEMKNEEFINQIPGFFGLLSLESKFISTNKTGSLWTGFSCPEDMVGLSYEDVHCKAAEDAELFIQHDKSVLINGTLRFLGYYSYAGNNWRVILGEKYPLKNTANEPIGLVSHFNDFTSANIIDLSRFLMNSAKRYNNYTNKQFFYAIEDNHLEIRLSARELECIFFFLRGKTAKEIAKILKLSPRTIEKHIEHIKIKFKCVNRSQLIEKALAMGYMNVLPNRLWELMSLQPSVKK